MPFFFLTQHFSPKIQNNTLKWNGSRLLQELDLFLGHRISRYFSPRKNPPVCEKFSNTRFRALWRRGIGLQLKLDYCERAKLGSNSIQSRGKRAGTQRRIWMIAAKSRGGDFSGIDHTKSGVSTCYRPAHLFPRDIRRAVCGGNACIMHSDSEGGWCDPWNRTNVRSLSRREKADTRLQRRPTSRLTKAQLWSLQGFRRGKHRPSRRESDGRTLRK